MPTCAIMAPVLEVKLPGANAKETGDMQITHLGVYWGTGLGKVGMQRKRAGDGASGF